ncbi:Peroxidase 72 [Zea mays]|uniref:Peroxidase 72 n=1 Tax=Zea mays TaxID=4577 RepID=A0A1D6J6Y7_MAIZE|nr:Peroxidase 72 [Zea mays]
MVYLCMYVWNIANCMRCTTDRRTRLGGATGEEGLADGQPERLEQPHPCSQRLSPHHHRQVRQPRPRHRRPRRTFRRAHHRRLALRELPAAAVRAEQQRAGGPDAEPGVRGGAAGAVPAVGRRPEPVRAGPGEPVPVRQPVLPQHPGHGRAAQLRRDPAHAEPPDHGPRPPLRRRPGALLRPLRQVHGQDGQHLAAHRERRRDQAQLQEGQPLVILRRDAYIRQSVWCTSFDDFHMWMLRISCLDLSVQYSKWSQFLF